ncbi:MAG TPA: HAMP domain-containing sensor histidine kinase [Actinomycetota bacterium]
MRGLRLRTQLTLSHATLALAMALVAAVPLLVASARARAGEMEGVALRDAEGLAGVANRKGVATLAGDVPEQHRTSVVLLDADGAVAGSGGPAGAALRAIAPDLGRRALDGYPGASVEVVGTGRRVVAWQPIVRGDEIEGAVVVAEPEVGRFPLAGGGLLLAILGLSLVPLAGGLGWMLAGRIAGPLEQLRGAVFRLALGDLSTRAPVGGRTIAPEVHALATAFNRVVTRLDRRAEEEMVARERRRALLRQLSHRIRTPLGVLALRSEEVGDTQMSPARRRLLARTLFEQVGALEEITREMFDLAAREDARVDPPVLVDLACSAREAVERIGPLAEWRGMRVGLTAQPGTMVWTGPAMLLEAVTELVVNAVKFSDRGRPVEVRVGHDGRTARMLVADWGAGPSPNPAGPAGRATAAGGPGRPGDVAPGSGMGLTLVAEVARRSGGALRLADRPGGGTVAVLELPLALGSATSETVRFVHSYSATP